MKLDTLLGPYLYQHKKLNLPGIGTFEADPSTVVPEDNDKHHTQVQGITFKQHSNPEPDNELIDFIKTHTGKMKPLAIADLESYLMLIKQFLNIGKPFYIEGIGTLQKMADGTLKFAPGEYISTKLENSTAESSTGANRKATDKNKNTSDNDTGRGAARKAILLLATMATVAVIGLGGYYLYKMKANHKEKEEAPAVDTVVTPVPDTTHATVIRPDSSMLVKDTTTKRRTDTTAKTQDPLQETLLRTEKDTAIHKVIKRMKPPKTVQVITTDSSTPVADTTTKSPN